MQLIGFAKKIRNIFLSIDECFCTTSQNGQPACDSLGSIHFVVTVPGMWKQEKIKR